MYVFLLLVTIAAVGSTDSSDADGVTRRLDALEQMVRAQQAKIQKRSTHIHEQEAKIDAHSVELESLKSQNRRLHIWHNTHHAHQDGHDSILYGNLTDMKAAIEKETKIRKATFVQDENNVDAPIRVGMDHIWLILCGALVMFMQAGFAVLEAGCCRSKNVQNVMLKNLTDVCVGTLAWWATGFAFAYGGPDDDGDGYLDNIVGSNNWFGNGFVEVEAGKVKPAGGKMRDWFFQWAFASAAATIVSGGVAERVKFPAYFVYSLIMTALIYPCVVAWTWGYGFLASVNDVGYMDFAGSGIVHMSGGVGALVGAAIAGPRDGRWTNPNEFVPHSIPLVVFGTFILWFGWYGFNCGSTLGLQEEATGELAAQVAMNTTIAAATGGVVVFALRFALLRGIYDVGGFCNGILAGLVSITAPCGNVHCYEAFIIGIIGGVIYQITSVAMKLCKIDDPIDAFAVHGACGAWGVLAAALFDWGKGFDYVHGWNGFTCVNDPDDANKCMEGAWVKLFAANILEIVTVFLWVGITSAIVFLPLRLAGFLRADEALQDAGMDQRKHSPSKAYTIDKKTANTAPKVTQVIRGADQAAMDAAAAAAEPDEPEANEAPREDSYDEI